MWSRATIYRKETCIKLGNREMENEETKTVPKSWAMVGGDGPRSYAQNSSYQVSILSLSIFYRLIWINTHWCLITKVYLLIAKCRGECWTSWMNWWMKASKRRLTLKALVLILQMFAHFESQILDVLLGRIHSWQWRKS